MRSKLAQSSIDAALGDQSLPSQYVPGHGCHLRLDLSRRVYFQPGKSTFGLWSFGVGVAVGPPR